MKGQGRNYGVDFLRSILMIFIVIGHLYAHTDIRGLLPFLSPKWMFTWLTQAITVCAVNCFVIITGYYMSQRVYRLWGGIKLWAKVVFYSTTISVIFIASGTIRASGKAILDAFFPVFRKEYWFFTMYILLYLLLPFLNVLNNNISKVAHGVLVVIILLFFYIEPIFSVAFYEFDPTEGFSIIAFISLYIVGAYLPKCEDLSKKDCLLLLSGSSLLMLFSKVLLELIVKRLELSFGTGLLYHNNSIFVLINAVALFELFKQIEINNGMQKILKWITPSVFAVYLIHENPLIRKLIWGQHLIKLLKDSSLLCYAVLVLGIGVSVFALGIAIDKALTVVIFRHVENSKAALKIKRYCESYDEMIRL